ncbi:MAG: 30S ribosomal protein S3ae, partial [Acidilobaceae archaeon]
KREIRKRMKEVVESYAKEHALDELINAMIFSDKENSLAQLIEAQARKIYPLRKVEVIKSKLLWVPGPEGPIRAVVVSPVQLKKEAR